MQTGYDDDLDNGDDDEAGDDACAASTAAMATVMPESTDHVCHAGDHSCLPLRTDRIEVWHVLVA